MLILRNIKKIYHTNKKDYIALENININFREKEFVAILGPSGSGKTTLLNIIGGIDKYTSGTTIIDGISTNIFGYKQWDYYRNNYIGFIFQDYKLFNNLSVYKNVELPLIISGVKNRRNKIIKIIRQVGLYDCVNKKIGELSGGQKQRVVVARALVNNPKIILADEPTASLDNKNSIIIMDLIKKVSKNKLVILVTHNKFLAKKYSNRIIYIKVGKIIRDTNPLYNIYSKQKFKTNKTKINYLTVLYLCVNNIRSKKLRTFLTVFASSISIISISLILSLSNGFSSRAKQFEKESFQSFPILITQSIKRTSIKHNKSNKYLYKSNNNNEHINNINNNYINYISKINKSYIDAILYNRINNFNIIVKTNRYKKIRSYELSFFELPITTNKSFITKNYKLLSGRYPTNKNEVVIVVNQNNDIDKKILELFDISNKKIKIEKIINKEMKILSNDDFNNEDTNNLYNNKNNITIKIVGVLKDNISLNDTSKIGYLNELTNEVVKKNKDSKIIKNNNLLASNMTKKQLMTYLNHDSIPTAISIYPSSFKNKNKVLRYLDNYNDHNKEKIIYSDYGKEVGNYLNKIIKFITIILTSFSSISLILTSLMIGIITYMSILEKANEIQILKSIGTSNRDIIKIFKTELLITGTLSGLSAILVTKIIIIPINIILHNVIGINKLANLTINDSIVLITISIMMALIGGYTSCVKAVKRKITIS